MAGEAEPGPPPIKHITENYVPLERIAAALVHKVYSELQTVLRSIQGTPSDVVRKREVLHFAVNSRQLLVKLYVLCKWSVVSRDISGCVDVSNWLYGQLNCFNNVVFQLHALQGTMAAAKQPHADLETALQVLKHGKPVSSSYEFVRPPEISPKEILSTFCNLNVLLAVRLALVENLPLVYRRYHIKNGHARFTVPGAMWVDLGIAEDSVNARFFYIDFGFLFIDQKPLNAAAARLEAAVNDKLAKHSLHLVLDWLLHFTSNYKLAVLSKRLDALERGVYHGVMSHVYSPTKSRLSISYWLQRPGSHEITLGIARDHNVQILWRVKEKQMAVPTNIVLDFYSSCDIEGFLERLLSHHASEIVAPLAEMFPWLERSGETKLSLQPTPSHASSLSIDVSSGKILLNAPRSHLAPTQEMLESVAVASLPDLLEQLRFAVIQEFIVSRAQALGWKAKTSLRMAKGELNKLMPDAKTALTLRLPSWPESWFVVVAFGALSVQWVAAQVASHERQWHVESVHPLHMDDINPDYSVFVRLAEACTAQFAKYELCHALGRAGVSHKIISKFEIAVDMRTIKLPDTKQQGLFWAESAARVTFGEVVRLTGMAKVNRLRELGSFSRGSLMVEQGKFQVTVKQTDLDYKSLFGPLKELDRAARFLMLAHSLNMKVLSVEVDNIVLEYAESGGVLTATADSVTLAEDNPQLPLAPFLPSLLAKDDMNTVVEMLRALFPLYKELERLGATVVPHSATTVLVMSTLPPDGPPPLKLTLKHWRGKPVIYFTTTGETAQKQVVIDLFTSTKYPGVYPLVQGVAALVEESPKILTELYSRPV